MRMLKTFPLVLLAFAVLAMAGEEASDAREIAGTVKKIGISMRAIKQDLAGNFSAEDPELSLVLTGEDGVDTVLRWDADTTFRNHKGRKIKKVEIGGNFKEGNPVMVRAVERDGVWWATEIQIQKR